ncbi:hypothetical protein [Formosa sp. S-31]|uniref:hypothetical protein n=1 Tax=Formosa sp. S-31 TaxID=2790949 RepID=UPI003EB81548
MIGNLNDEISYDFIASSKVIRYKLDPASADILATLMYKFKYWRNEDKLKEYKGEKGFYISHDDLEKETSYSKNIIQNRIKKLKQEKLINVKRQGLNKPNIYFLDLDNIARYINKHEGSYKNYLKDTGGENSSKKPVVPKIGENQLSGSQKKRIQENKKVANTKNKNTKNKKTYSPVCHMDVEKIKDIDEKEDELSDLLESIVGYDDDELEDRIKIVAEFLLKLVPGFKGIKLEAKDYEAIRDFAKYRLYCWDISSKIIENAKRIVKNKYTSSFSNLFIGLKQFNENVENKYFV